MSRMIDRLRNECAADAAARETPPLRTRRATVELNLDALARRYHALPGVVQSSITYERWCEHQEHVRVAIEEGAFERPEPARPVLLWIPAECEADAVGAVAL